MQGRRGWGREKGQLGSFSPCLFFSVLFSQRKETLRGGTVWFSPGCKTLRWLQIFQRRPKKLSFFQKHGRISYPIRKKNHPKKQQQQKQQKKPTPNPKQPSVFCDYVMQRGDKVLENNANSPFALEKPPAQTPSWRAGALRVPPPPLFPPGLTAAVREPQTPTSPPADKPQVISELSPFQSNRRV